MGGICGGGSNSASNKGSVSNSKSSYSAPKTSTSTKKRSAGRGSGRNKNLRQTVQSTARSIGTDLKMGLSTFGQTGERQAQTLRDQGYSERAIQSYQERTAATKARMAASPTRTEYGRDSIVAGRVPSPSGISFGGAPSASAPAPTPPPAPGSGEIGSAEEAVIEGAKKRKGRASTIETAPSGLLTEAKTRRRRSLMGGLIS